MKKESRESKESKESCQKRIPQASSSILNQSSRLMVIYEQCLSARGAASQLITNTIRINKRRNRRCRHLLNITQIEEINRANPRSLSGRQRQTLIPRLRPLRRAAIHSPAGGAAPAVLFQSFYCHFCVISVLLFSMPSFSEPFLNFCVIFVSFLCLKSFLCLFQTF